MNTMTNVPPYQSYDSPEQPRRAEGPVGEYDVLRRAERAYGAAENLRSRMDARVAALRQTDGRLSQELSKNPSPAIRGRITETRALIARHIAEIEKGKAELIARYNETMRDFSRPKPVLEDAEKLNRVDAVINEFAQKVGGFESTGALDASLRQAGETQQALRGQSDALQQQTDQMLTNYDTMLDRVYGDRNVREAQQEVDAAERDLQQANEDAAVNGLDDLKAEKTRLEGERTPKQGKLRNKNRLLETAKTDLQTLTAAKTAAEAWPAEIAARERDLQTAKDAVDVAQRTMDQKRTDAVAGRVKADYLTKPKVDDAIAACDADADAAKAAVPAGPDQAAQIAAIQAKRDADVPLIRAFFEAQTAHTAARRKVAPAQTKVTEAITKVTDAATDVGVLVAGRAWPEVHADVLKELQKKIDPAQKKVTDLEKAVADLEQEIEEDYTARIEELDEQIAALEEPIDQAKEAKRVAQQTVRALRPGVARRRVSSAQQRAFLDQSRTLLTQINKEGMHIRTHFRGEEAVETRSIDLLSRRTDIATEIAERSGTAQDIRKALDYTREELRWLNRNADQHADRITALMNLERTLNVRYVALLTAETNKLIAAGTPEQKVTAIERELHYLPGVDTPQARIREKYLSNPEAGAVRGQLQLARDTQYALLRAATTATLTADPDQLSDNQLSKAKAAVLAEGRFLKRTNHVPVEGGRLDEGRFAHLNTQYHAINRAIAARGYNRLNQATEAARQNTDARGLVEGMGVMQTELAQLRMANARPERQRELQTQLTEQIRAVAERVDADVRTALSSQNADTITQAMEGVRSEIAMHTERGMPESERRAGELRSNYEALLTALQNLSASAHSDAMTPEATPQQMASAFVLLNREEQQLQNAPKVSMLVSRQENGSWTQQREMQLPIRFQNRLQNVRAMRSELMQRVTAEIDQLAQKRTSLDAKSVARAIVLIDLEKQMDAVSPVANQARAAERLNLRSELMARRPAALERETVQQSRIEVQTRRVLDAEIKPQLLNGAREMSTDDQIAQMRKPKNSATRLGRIAWLKEVMTVLERMQESQVSQPLKSDILKAQVVALRLLSLYQTPQENSAAIQKRIEEYRIVADAKISRIRWANTVAELQQAMTEAEGFIQTLDAWSQIIEAQKYSGQDAIDALKNDVAGAIDEGKAILQDMQRRSAPPAPPSRSSPTSTV